MADGIKLDTQLYDFNPNTLQPIMQWEDVRNAYLINKGETFNYLNEIYKNYYMRTKDREEELNKTDEQWRTNLRAPITHMFANGMFNLLMQSNFDFVAIDRLNKFPGIVDEIMTWVDYIVSSNDTIDTLWSSSFDACLIGWGYYKTWYRYVEREYEYVDKKGESKTIKDTDDYPFIRYISPYNLFTISGYNDINTRMWIERRVIPIQKIEDEYKLLGLKAKKGEIQSGTFVDDTDWEAIKTNMSLYNVAAGNNIYQDNTYQIKNRFCEVFELTSDNTISIWINQVYHGTFKKPGPYRKMDYHTITFKKNPGSRFSIGIGYIVKSIQYAFDAILNMRIDNVKLAMNKMFLVDGQASFFGNQTYLKASPGKIIKVRSTDSIKEVSTSEVNNSGYVEVDSLFSLTQGLVGMSSPMLGMQGKVERTATGSDMIKEASDAQLRYILKSISRNMGETLKEMLILSLVYADEETFDRVLGPDNNLKNVDVKDLMDNVTFTFEATGPKSENMTIKNQQMMQLLQIAAQTANPQTGQPVLDTNKLIEELLKSMNLDPTEYNIQENAVATNNTSPMNQAMSAQNTTVPEEVPNPMQGMAGDLQQIPGAGVPVDMMTNPTGKNT